MKTLPTIKRFGTVFLSIQCALLVAQTAVEAALPGVLDSALNAANGHIYYLLDNSIATDAEAKAVQLGGHLVTINDAAENAFVFNRWSTNRNLWIGLNDPFALTDGTGAQHAANFVWFSGESSAYRNWRSGEPNNSTGVNGPEGYAYILAAGLAGQGQWNDYTNNNFVNGQPLLFGVVETVPEPSSLIVAAAGVIALVLGFRQRG